MWCRNDSWFPCYRWKRRGSGSQFAAGVPSHRSTLHSLVLFTGTQHRQWWPTSTSIHRISEFRGHADILTEPEINQMQGDFIFGKGFLVVIKREKRDGGRGREREKLGHTAVTTWALEIPTSGFAFSSHLPCYTGKGCLPKPQRTQHSKVWMNENHCLANHLTYL